jgi:signal transduction histidine kinase
VPSAAETATDRILSHLSEIGAGKCTITEEAIVQERDPNMSQILLGLLVLHEDLAYERKLRDQAQAAQLVVVNERERLLEELEKAVAARDQFLALASHELRTPLSTMTLLVDNFVETVTVAGSGKPAALIPQHLSMLKRQVERLGTLVLEMLAVSKITGGGLDLVPAAVDLAAIVREVVERFGLEIERRHVTVEMHAGLPVVGMWDGARLDQVVTNLLSNALKFGAGRPVEISVRSEADRAVLIVRDRGIGIAPQIQSKIFGPFSGAVSSRHHAGLGLGLWITHQIVRASGGSIAVESRPDEGSTFTVELPR